MNTEQKLREAFNHLDAHEQQEFFARLIHAVRHDNDALYWAQCIITNAQKNGVFNSVSFGSGIYKENDLITVID